jgi:AcrR family transcriptional regulator
MVSPQGGDIASFEATELVRTVKKNSKRLRVNRRQPVGKDARPVRRRLTPEARCEMISSTAIAFFSERGFDGQLKELAKIVGVSEALIFSYFGSKQVLIEKVYERVYVARWKAAWYDTLTDRSKPLEQRLNEYYKDYLAAIDEPIWIRIVLYSGLAGNALTRRYVKGRVEKLLRAIVAEVQDAFHFYRKGLSRS